MNDARETSEVSISGFSIFKRAAFSLGLSYFLGYTVAQNFHGDPVVSNGSGEAVFVQLFMGVIFGLATGVFVRKIARPRPAWMGYLITVCSIVFLYAYYLGSKVVPRPPFWFPLALIVATIAIAYVRIPKIKPRRSTHGP
jgi:hypothetical protein